MPKYLIILLFLLLSNLCLFSQHELSSFQRQFQGMGTQISMAILWDDEEQANEILQIAQSEFERIEILISSWNENSQTSKINQNAGIQPIKVDLELFELIKRSKQISKLTRGRFDISFASIDNVWKFDGSMMDLPLRKEIRKSVSKINYKHILLNEKDTSVFLKKRGMKIGFGAIGKGYAVDKIKGVIQELGIKNGLVNAGGDLTAWGKNSKNQAWRIGVIDPKDETNLIGFVPIENSAIVTSGNTEQFIVLGGRRYSHIINPKTGWPSQGIKTVTILSSDTELADALATSVFVLGMKKGMKLIEKLTTVEGLIVTDSDEVIVSKHFPFSKRN